MHLKYTVFPVFMLLSCLFNIAYAAGWEEYDFANIPSEQQEAVSQLGLGSDEYSEGAISDEFGRLDLLKSEFYQVQERLRFYTMLAICVVALFTLSIVLRFLTHMNYTPRDVINVTGLVLIIFATVMVVTIADVGEQLTASIGVLGAVAGYLFGSMDLSRTT